MQGIDLRQNSKEIAKKLDDYIKSNYEAVVEDFVKCFCKFCEKIEKEQKENGKGRIAFIHFFILRTNILLKKHEIKISAYDQNWYLDDKECCFTYPVDDIYSYLDEFGDVLEKFRVDSIGKISIGEVQQRLFEESKIYLFFVAEIIRQGMKIVAQKDEFKRVLREDCFVVGIGEYMDKFDILYKEDSTPKDSKVVKSALQSKNQKIHSYEIIEGLELVNGDYEGLEFQYPSFRGSNFSESSFKNGSIIFGDCSETIFKNTNMENTKLFDVRFTSATLENISFKGSKLRALSFEGAKLNKVDFSEALVADELDFTNATMIDCKLPKKG